MNDEIVILRDGRMSCHRWWKDSAIGTRPSVLFGHCRSEFFPQQRALERPSGVTIRPLCDKLIPGADVKGEQNAGSRVAIEVDFRHALTRQPRFGPGERHPA